MEKQQDELLLKITKFAYNEVQFYQDLAKKNNIDITMLDKKMFVELPLITKEMLSKKQEDLISDNCKKYENREKISIRRTSGSTGQYMRIYWHQYDNIRSLTGLWIRRKRNFGINTNDKYCYFYTTDYIFNKFILEKDEIYSISKRSLGFSKNNLTTERIREVYNKILEFNPDWLLLQPSIALLLTNLIINEKLPLISSLRYIELTGEYLTCAARYEIENTFKCKTANQYGCNEVNSIASDCTFQKMHIQSSNVYVEIINDGKPVQHGEEGEIYITTLQNYSMPFIRYKIGERGKIIEPFHCECGCNDFILELSNGRSIGFISNDKGESIPTYILARPIEYINEKVGNVIKQFQVIQTGKMKFNVKLSIMTSYINWKETIKELYLEEMKEKSLKNAKWTFEFTDELFPENLTGKLSYFINENEEKNQ